MKSLPSKLSDLLSIAHIDLRKAEADPRFVIDMSTWLEPLGNGKCAICLAGAVLAFSLNHPIDREAELDEMATPDINNKLVAINYLRMGEIFLAWWLMDSRSVVNDMIYDLERDAFPLPNRDMPRYGEPGFHDALDALEQDLRNVGL